MKLKRRMRTIEEAFGYKEFWQQCQRFFGYNNFTHEEIMSIMHQINSYYFMGKVSEVDGDNKAQAMEMCSVNDQIRRPERDAMA